MLNRILQVQVRRLESPSIVLPSSLAALSLKEAIHHGKKTLRR